ncbi:MAG: UDP-N-acetylmuramoyl-tripeptide--D-alanyl-D-alanine ligase [Candidatus Saccharibacteria bacterium]
MKSIIVYILRVLTRLTLLRYKPRIVGITGSVGKTSTKEAVSAVLKDKFKIRSSQGNYNNELGLPLAVLGEKTGGRNPVAWAAVILKSLAKLVASDYPDILVLEMGSDRPGDIRYLLDLSGPLDCAVITTIGISHLEYFGSREELAKEKLTLLKGLARKGFAVLNFDDERVWNGRKSAKGDVIGYGFNPEADVSASDFQIIRHDDVYGVNFKILHRGTVVPFFLPQSLGKPAVYAALAAAAVGLGFGMNLVDVSEALRRNFNPPPGRLRLLSGIKRSWILDDTYNAAPASTVAALETLSILGAGRKLAAIGQMAELGEASDEGHRQVAAKLLEIGAEAVFLVGGLSRIIKDELEKLDFKGGVYWFETSDDARLSVQEELREGDTLLVKGSQSARMEKIVKEIMADPEAAPRLLVRQSGEWENR